MPYLTFDNLSIRTFSTSTVLNESIKSRTYRETEVFLSYRREDKDWVNGIVRFLKGFDISVYIDYLDQTLEEKTNDEVAKTLRAKIQSCSKFISLATPNSGKSKWMPWELGLGDRITNHKNVALLPLTSNSSIWSDQEYSKIYGKIENIPSVGFNAIDTWYVIAPKGPKVNLKIWLST
jgi:hypothetical protein